MAEEKIAFEVAKAGVARFQCGNRPYAVEIKATRDVIIVGVSGQNLVVTDLGEFINCLQNVQKKAKELGPGILPEGTTPAPGPNGGKET